MIMTEALEHAEKLLQTLFPDEDWEESPHLQRTPERFVDGLRELTTRPDFDFTTFPNENDVDEMVVMGPIDFHSLCSHHLLPFIGSAWVAYIPGYQLVGLSKLARTVKYFAPGLWAQEDLNHGIVDFLEQKLKPRGSAVVMRAEHLCMSLRGVNELGATTTTSAMRGVFLDPDRDARHEFLSFVRNGD